jgi:hypothetical protein
VRGRSDLLSGIVLADLSGKVLGLLEVRFFSFEPEEVGMGRVGKSSLHRGLCRGSNGSVTCDGQTNKKRTKNPPRYRPCSGNTPPLFAGDPNPT